MSMGGSGFVSAVGFLPFDSVLPVNEAHTPADELHSLAEGRARKGEFMNPNFHFDNDAHVDDLVAFLLLQAAVGKKLLSVTVSHGDSIMASALETYRRLFNILGSEYIKLGAGQKGVHNEFPMAWRKISDEINAIESISRIHSVSQSSKIGTSHEILKESAQKGPIRLITTGPLTNISEWFHLHPEDMAKVHSLVIMGGALKVAGNVNVPELSDGTAEWNFFADPEAAEGVLNSGVSILLVPLDVAGRIAVSEDFLKLLGQRRSIRSRLAHQLWSMAYHRYNYYLWDVIAAVAAISPELFTIEEHRLAVVTKGQAQGRLIKDNVGTPCQVATNLRETAVLEMMMNLLEKE